MRITWLPVSSSRNSPGLGEPEQRLLLALAHLGGRLLDHPLEQPPLVLERELLATERQQVPAAREAFARVDRLGQEIRDPGIERGVAHLPVVVHGHHDHRDVRVLGHETEPPDELDAVDLRHLVVDQDEIRGVGGGPAHRVDRALERLDRDVHVDAADDFLENGAAGRLVVDDHDRVLDGRDCPDPGPRHQRRTACCSNRQSVAPRRGRV